MPTGEGADWADAERPVRINRHEKSSNALDGEDFINERLKRFLL
jgi:hypothetical protein